MADPVYEISKVERLPASLRRGVAFLCCPTIAELNARTVYQALQPKRVIEINARFDHWIGFGTGNHLFHGFPGAPNYADCFVFKWKEGRVDQRLHGFLWHPRPKTAAGFQLCVLCSNGPKTKWESDYGLLDDAVRYRADAHVRQAIARAYPDVKDSKAITK